MVYYIGDSIAEGYRNAANAAGDTKVGRSPAAVLAAIRAATPGQLAGQRIVLSTGLSNNPNDLGSVSQQLEELKAKGVDPANIQVVGLGSRFNNLNPTLGDMVSKQGASFSGGFQAGPDGVHPASYAMADNSGPQSTPATTAPAGGANAPVDTRQSIFQILRGKGLTPNQALGVMYSMAGEGSTAFDPNSLGDNKSSYGWGQWHAERADALMNTAKQMGTTWNDPSAQLAHFQNEINGPYSKVIDAVKAGNDSAADATRIWTAQYEAPKVNNWQQRLGNGAQAFSVDANGNFQLKPGAPPSPSVNPAVASTTSPGATTAPAAPVTSGAQDFAAAAQKGDVGGALAALNKGQDGQSASKGALGSLGDQLAQAQGHPMQSSMLPTQMGYNTAAAGEAGRAQAGQALMSQLMAQQAKPLSWSSAPYGTGTAGQVTPGTTLNSMGYGYG